MAVNVPSEAPIPRVSLQYAISVPNDYSVRNTEALGREVGVAAVADEHHPRVNHAIAGSRFRARYQ